MEADRDLYRTLSASIQLHSWNTLCVSTVKLFQNKTVGVGFNWLKKLC